jgi:hypothetical protein
MRRLAVLAAVGACTRPSPAPVPAPVVSAPAPAPSVAAEAAAPVASDAPVDAAPPQLDADGDDDAVDTGQPPLPAGLHFERVGRAPMALQRVCDLTPLGDSLYASHANQPLGTDGATISRYRPDDAHPFSVAFDWNRPGEPTKGGGAGQGFLRVHAIDGRLFVPDTDPPYAGLGLVDPGTEGYVFVSDAGGTFARARMPGHRPPSAPEPGRDGKAGAGVLPRAYHVLDVVRFRGKLYASTGSVPPKERAWSGPSPGALHVADDVWARWTYEIDYPFPWQAGVWRLTYLARFRDRLYAGIQDYDGREPNDYVVFAPPPGAAHIAHEDVHAFRVTPGGASLTLRWFADAGKLWWIAIERDGNVTLRVTDDGDAWRAVPLPADAGRPADVARWRGALVVLTEWGLWRVDVDPAVQLAHVESKKTPFAVNDAFCAAPLAVYRGDLYAGDQRDGSLWRVAPQP